MDKLTLDDVRFFARHGVIEAEETIGTWFSVDVHMDVDLTAASLSDDLGAAIDYGTVAKRIVEIGTGPRVKLLERIAGLLAESLLREFPATAIRVRVRKLTAPLAGIVGTPGVEITRRR